MPICKSCRREGHSANWGRYARNGRLKALCPACDQETRNARSRTAAARAAGYQGWGNTPEYKRRQREAAAAKLGRTIALYAPQAETAHRRQLRNGERLADQIRARWAAEWLKPFQISFRDDPEFRERRAAEIREYYRQHKAEEVARIAKYKAEHPERNRAWSLTRKEREFDLSDGTVTKEAIGRLKRAASCCAYCDAELVEKETDHMIALALGGEHSLRNIVIVCPECNARKADLSYAEWTDRVDPQHRDHVMALYVERYSEAAEVAA